MSFLARPAMASLAARAMQRLTALADRRIASSLLGRYPEYPGNTRELTVPTSFGPARAVVYLPGPDAATDTAPGPTPDSAPPVHVNFHGGGYVLPPIQLDDPLCRFLAAEAGVAVVNVDYVVAPQHPFPASPRQAYEIVRWVAGHGAEHGWDGDRLTVGGQSAGGGLAAAVARQALEAGDVEAPSIALQVLHYPPLDLATDARDKRAAIAKPMLRPWMADVFDSAYVPDPRRRTDPWSRPPIRRTPRISRASPRPSSSPRSTTSCARRASGTPSGCARPVRCSTTTTSPEPTTATTRRTPKRPGTCTP